MSKWGDPSRYEAPNREAVDGAKRELSILLSGWMVALFCLFLVSTLFQDSIDSAARVLLPMLMIGLFLAPPLSVVGFITSRGGARWITGSLTVATFLIVGGIVWTVL